MKNNWIFWCSRFKGFAVKFFPPSNCIKLAFYHNMNTFNYNMNRLKRCMKLKWTELIYFRWNQTNFCSIFSKFWSSVHWKSNLINISRNLTSLWIFLKKNIKFEVENCKNWPSSEIRENIRPKFDKLVPKKNRTHSFVLLIFLRTLNFLSFRWGSKN